MTFLTVKTRRKSASFRIRYLRAGGPVPSIIVRPSLPPASFTPSVVPIPYGLDTTSWHGTGGAYHVSLDRRCDALSSFLSPDRASNDEMVIGQHHLQTAYLLVTALGGRR
jgi:hypothetical protein